MSIIGSHLVGSLNTSTAKESFTLASELIGKSLKRVPDGEFGDRSYWLLFQGKFLDKVKGISRIGDQPFLFSGFDLRPFHFDKSVSIKNIVIPNLGYADAALNSYREFKDMKNGDKFSPHTRFQVSLPTPIAVTSAFFIDDPESRLIFEGIYEKALLNEITRIVEHIPVNDLAIQFDMAIEFAYIEKAPLPGYGTQNCWYGEPLYDAAWRVADLINSIPDQVSVGIHLCYGDVAEKHFIEPKDTKNLVLMANAITQETLNHPLDWIHLPVPFNGVNETYFAPLTELKLSTRTEIYLGLIHREDGAEGLQKRINIAEKFIPHFGISTECGFGRTPIEDRENIFKLHKISS